MSERERGGSEGGQGFPHLLRTLSIVLSGVDFYSSCHCVSQWLHVHSTVRCLLFSRGIKWLHTPGPFPLSAHVFLHWTQNSPLPWY